MPYVATTNVPGYMPQDDEPPVFDTTAEAWSYLADERERAEDDENAASGAYSGTHTELRSRAQEDHGTGTVHGDTPGYDGDHDLGLAYSVEEV